MKQLMAIKSQPQAPMGVFPTLHLYKPKTAGRGDEPWAPPEVPATPRPPHRWGPRATGDYSDDCADNDDHDEYEDVSYEPAPG